MRVRAMTLPLRTASISGNFSKRGSTISVISVVMDCTPVASMTCWAWASESGEEAL